MPEAIQGALAAQDIDLLPMPNRGLTHVDPLGRARMVDVTPKEPTHRRAIAAARSGCSRDDSENRQQCDKQRRRPRCCADRRHSGGKAHRRAHPLCHPLLVGSVALNFTIGDDFVEVETQVEAVDRTGVEMEAMTACAVAALTIYDMCKSADRSMVVEELCLWEKTGGRSGVWRREREPGQSNIHHSAEHVD